MYRKVRIQGCAGCAFSPRIGDKKKRGREISLRHDMRLPRCVLALCLALPLFAQAQAHILDEVETAVDKGVAEIRIRFTVPVRYLRHFPAEHGELLQIYFRVATLDGQELSLRDETHKVRATPALPGFTVTYTHPGSRDIGRDPLYVVLQFDRAVTYKLREGDDNYSINLYVPVTPSESRPPVPAAAPKPVPEIP
jgi:hypothetical protein